MSSILLTGANGSLGLHAVSYILQDYPQHTAILTVRNDAPSDPNTAKLLKTLAAFPDAKYEIHKVDLSVLAEVHALADKIRAQISSGKTPRLAAIICNAMVWTLHSGLKFSKDGYEQSLAVNHLAHFALTVELASSMDRERGRIVFVGSEAAWPGKAGLEKYPPKLPEDLEKLAKPNPDKAGEEVGRGFQRYGLSKLAHIMNMYELGRRLKKVCFPVFFFLFALFCIGISRSRRHDEMQTNPTIQTQEFANIKALATDPGGLVDSRTWSQDDIPGVWSFLMKFITALFPLMHWLQPRLRLSKHAARDVVDLALSDEFKDQEGHFDQRVPGPTSPESLDETLQRRLWEKSVEWCGLKAKDVDPVFLN